MPINREFLHAASIHLLYAGMVILTFVIVERLVFYFYLTARRARIAKALALAVAQDPAWPQPQFDKSAADVMTRAMSEYMDVQREGNAPRERVEDVSTALFLRVDRKINRGLWILDTIVTAAPLLGLLGTILGIMDTFNALSAGGISDPGAVSRGIGSALFATAIGIGTALYGLLGYNILHRFGESLSDEFKSFLLEATLSGQARRAEMRGQRAA
ncbi:MotA/TolQ/ExbB proton channel family protein [Paraburkholderia phenazinium]|uniref:Outer membrane transport energization protein ExbB n=1 Tax=Paraburkholderia phenazinium TaxID=60549 RepID=A0A1N6J0M5_9BURK|nr:MotA/TolQ/ExbB proton channel family protein [Paraburkholderia phenazinium]SIO37676.1 outer membrane transport energization protein ExbB [Paraburkholderia phenazinium]